MAPLLQGAENTAGAVDEPRTETVTVKSCCL